MTVLKHSRNSETVEADVPETLKHRNPEGSPPEFGHGMLSYFSFKPNYLNVNNGSFGALPKCVLQTCLALSEECGSSPDQFMRRTIHPLMIQARKELADLIVAPINEVVLVPNATYGVNTVLRNLEWSQDDVLVGFSTTYGAVSRTLQYLSDVPPHPQVSTVALTFPSTRSKVIELFRNHIKSIPRTPGGKIVAIIDGIISNPGCLLPWAEMVEICKLEEVLSVVDAAHCIGQVKVDLSSSQPDFWISTCHKWLFTKRSAAVLYVPKRNQHLIKTTFPTSFDYVSPSDPVIEGLPPPPNFVRQFEWFGTIDFTPYLSINAAISFRKWLGGEEKINEYCHNIAIKGADRLAEVLNTRVMDETGESRRIWFVANVALPFPDLGHLSQLQQLHLIDWIEDKLLYKYQTFVALFLHNGEWWARCSAQIWNEVSDFEQLGQILLAAIQELQDKVTGISGE